MILVKENKNGFTLVELLVSMAIIVTLMVMMIGIINPIAMMAKARDSERKDDLNKFKKAFEEYYNDKGFYPVDSDLKRWNVLSNCNKKIDEISQYLNVWPCGPNNSLYTVASKDNWFKVVTNLENKKDNDIPEGWYDESRYLSSGFDRKAVNYGVSSTNILWYEGELDCNISVCNVEGCNAAPGNRCNEAVDGRACYYGRLNINRSCNDPVCRVPCCGLGCNE